VKVFIYVQHLVGIGHLRRALLLALAMERHGLETVVVSGGRPVSLFPQTRVRPLPPAHCSPDDYSTLLDDDGRPVTEAWKERRAALLLEYFEHERPDVLLLETFPFGRRQLRFELLPLLESARFAARRPRILCSIRDVLQRRSEEREDETIRLLNDFFDEVWVHGDPDWIGLERSFSRTADIVPEVVYTGYVSEPWSGNTAANGEGVLVSSGGGAAGIALMRCAAEARELSKARTLPWRFLVGGNLSSDQQAELAALAGPGASIEPVRPDFKDVLAGCRVSISQFGYNTAVDLLQTRARAVVVPFEGSGETEQRTRAEAMAGKNLFQVVPESALTPRSLAEALGRAMARPRPEAPAIQLGGAGRCAGWLAGAGVAVSP
jgi:predicted glycosyltransferase